MAAMVYPRSAVEGVPLCTIERCYARRDAATAAKQLCGADRCARLATSTAEKGCLCTDFPIQERARDWLETFVKWWSIRCVRRTLAAVGLALVAFASNGAGQMAAADAPDATVATDRPSFTAYNEAH